MVTFRDLKLSEEFLKNLDKHSFTTPTEIQLKSIPLAIEGKDILGKSATGSGKTLAFGASIIEKAEKGKGIQALVLTPTRELAEQVCKSLKQFAEHKHLKIIPVYGGVSMERQMDELRYADVVVGTPGRLLDHMFRNTIKLQNMKVLVLDEADRMLDMGFIRDVTKILEACPRDKQMFLFSATFSGEITRIAKKYMNNPEKIAVESYVDPTKLQQYYIDVFQNEKLSLLAHLLKNDDQKLVMVFCNTKRNADFVAKNLHGIGLNALALHGDLSQNQRSRVLEKFNTSERFILICTDVAARGLDIKNVSHVYLFDTSNTPSEYVHRIGRTARAGKEGKAITLLSERDRENFQRIMYNHTFNIERLETPVFDKLEVKTNFGGRGDSRQSRGHFGGRNFEGGRSRGSFGSGSRSFGGRGSFRPRRSFSEGGSSERSSEGGDREGFRARRSSFGGRSRGGFSGGSRDGGDRRPRRSFNRNSF